MKKIIFTVALLVATVGVFGTSEAAWFFSKKVEKSAETNTSANSAAVGKTAFGGESKEAKLTIMKKGEDLATIVGGAKVISNTAGVLTTEVIFGLSKVNLIVKTDTETKVFRAYDGKGSVVAEISTDDIISLDGILDTTATSLTVTAKKIKDYSMQAAGANYSGVVSTLTITENTDGKVGSFKLPLANQSNKFVTVFVSATTKIASTSKDLKLSDMKDGDFVVGARGIVNNLKLELRASEIKFSSSGKTTQSRLIYNQPAKYDPDQVDYSVNNAQDLSANTATVFVKTTAGERLEVRIDESAMVGTFIVENGKDKGYVATKGVFKWMAKEKKSVSSTLSDLGLVAGDAVWVSGQNFVKDGTVNAYRFEKQVK